MAVNNLDQLVDLIITHSPKSGEDIRTFVKGEISDFLAHMPAKYGATVSLVLYDHYVDFINFIIRDSKRESNKGEKK